ncbi:MAG: VirB3 family type IV secretion system protein [Acidithiobacillus sp.]|nr:VirB3 family type IV secretion system protein [Acidithiobacillus sp.]
MAETTRRLPLHQSLVKPMLVAGGEREAVFALAFVCIAAPILFSLWLIPVSVIVAGVGFSFLRSLAKKDPQALGVIRRHWGQQAFYPAASSAYAPVKYKSPKEQSQSVASGGVLSVISKLMKRNRGPKKKS